MIDLSLTQEALANRAEISQGMVYKLVAGKAKSTSKIVQLAQALECDVEWLATGVRRHTSSQVAEEPVRYPASKSALLTELKKQIRTLPVEDQKALAIDILENLIA